MFTTFAPLGRKLKYTAMRNRTDYCEPAAYATLCNIRDNVQFLRTAVCGPRESEDGHARQTKKQLKSVKSVRRMKDGIMEERICGKEF